MAAAAPAIGQFGQQNQRAVLSEDGEQLLLAMRSLLRALQGGHQVPSVSQVRNTLQRNLQEPWLGMQAHFVHSAALAQAGDAPGAFAAMGSSLEGWLEFQREQRQGNWWLPGLYQACSWYRQCAYAADKSAGPQSSSASASVDLEGGAGVAGGKYPNSLAAIELLNRFSRSMVQARADDVRNSRKLGLLSIIVNLFKLYFRVNNLSLCRSLVATVHNPSFPPMEVFPVGQIVTYKYYGGRLQLFNEDYEGALESLSDAFERCHRAYPRNLRRILRYLVPLKMWFGQPPSPELLQKFELAEQYGPLVQAIREGNVQAFDQTLRRWESYFISVGVYLLLEKLRESCFLQLFKRVFLITSATPPGNQIPIRALLAAARFSSGDPRVDVNEVECYLANLIFQGRMRGYIAHDRAVVVSKNQPFPDPQPAGGRQM